MKRLVTCCMAMILLSGCAKNKKPTYYDEQKRTLTATVEAIDPKTRPVTLRGDEGNELSLVASDDVRNLDQVKVGDRVAVDYTESVSIQVKPPGEAVNDTRTAEDRAEPGDKPGGMIAEHTT